MGVACRHASFRHRSWPPLSSFLHHPVSPLFLFLFRNSLSPLGGNGANCLASQTTLFGTKPPASMAITLFGVQAYTAWRSHDHRRAAVVGVPLFATLVSLGLNIYMSSPERLMYDPFFARTASPSRTPQHAKHVPLLAHRNGPLLPSHLAFEPPPGLWSVFFTCQDNILNRSSLRKQDSRDRFGTS